MGEAPADDGIVEPGMIVVARIAGDEETFLLGSREIAGDSDLDVFSEKSPLGAAIMGHKEGDKLSYTAPNGKDITVEIISAKPYVGLTPQPSAVPANARRRPPPLRGRPASCFKAQCSEESWLPSLR